MLKKYTGYIDRIRKFIIMKNFKKKEYNSLDGSFLKNHNVQKKHKANILAHENQIPIDWHEVKIILDATVVEKYLNNRKSSGTISPSHREKILVQKIPRLNQHVFSENSNVMVKLEIPEDIRVDDNLSPKDSLGFDDVPVKQEDGILLLDSLDKNAFYNGEFIETLNEDFQCQDRGNFTVEAALKNEIVESECCYEETIIGQEFKDALKNEELFVGEEFKHEESVPSYENVESINQENNEEIIKKKTRSTRKRKRCPDCDDCNRGLEKKSRVPSHSKVVTPKLPFKDPKKCKSQMPSKPSKFKYFLRSKKQTTDQESSTKPKSQKGYHRVYHCVHCDYKGRRKIFIQHCRNEHPYLISKFCSIEAAKKKKKMIKHSKTMHPKKIHVKEGGKSSNKICAKKKLELKPFGQSYKEFRKYFLEMESEHIKLYCLKCEMTHDKIISKTAPLCIICKSQLLYQCQKCKEFRNCYSDIWEHLMNQKSGCSICDSFIGDDEPANTENLVPTVSSNESENSTGDDESSNSTNQAPKISSNGAKSHDCEICGFKGTTRTHLNEHIRNYGTIRNGFDAMFHFGEMRFIKPEGLCSITVRFPCRFCPLTCYDSNILFYHIAYKHRDEVDGKDIGEFIKEARNFIWMVKEVNDKWFNNKLRNETWETEKDDYHEGIESMLKPICIECKANGPHNREYCVKCQVNLSFVCLKCDELFSKYSVAWDHATRTCENRSFTLTLEETYLAKVGASSSDEELFYCKHCSFKNASKSILYKHIESSHHESTDIQSLLSYPKNLAFVYTCQFCNKSSSEFHVIERHIAWSHNDKFRCEDTLEEILDQVVENKKPRMIKPSYRYDYFGRRIRRTFSENLKLAIFYCPNCDDTVDNNFRRVADTRKCPKCNCKLRVYCKKCNKDYIYWEQIAVHFQNMKCSAAKIGTNDMDHSYCLRQPLPEVAMNSVTEDRDVGSYFYYF